MHPSQLTAGALIPAGLGESTVLPSFDFETYSEAGFIWNAARNKWDGPPHASGNKKGLPVIGAASYAHHPSTEVLSLAYNLKRGGDVRLWVPGMPPPVDLLQHLQTGGLIEAWNSAFEYWIWNCVCTRRYGWPPLPFTQLRCAMAKARAHSLPGKLDTAGQVLNLSIQKDKRGNDLLKKFSMPQNPTAKDPRKRHTLAEHPQEAQELFAYNATDTQAEDEASSRCPDLTGEELDFWLLDQLINRRGVAVDVPSLHACAYIVEECLGEADAEMLALTGGAVERCSQLERLKGWLAGQGVRMREGKGSGDDEAIQAAVEGVDYRLAQLGPITSHSAEYLIRQALPLQEARRALELRQLAGSASVKKVFAMVNTLGPDGRLHDLFNYHGAHTGRPTGDGPQPTNLFKAGPMVHQCVCGRWTGGHRAACVWCGFPFPPGAKPRPWCPDAAEDALAAIRLRSLTMLRDAFGNVLLTVAGCLRALFIAAAGCELIASDFSSIEGVVTACLAGEDWRVEMFATHGKAYELSVSKISGIPFADIMKHAGYDDVTSPLWWTRRARKGDHHPLRQTLGKVSELASGFGGWIGAWIRFGADAFMSEDEIKAGILAWRKASPAIEYFWGGQMRKAGYGWWVPELFGLEGMAVKAIQNPGVRCPVWREDGTHTGVTFLKHQSILYCILPSGRPLTYHNARLEHNTPERRDKAPHAIAFERWNTNPQQGAIGWVTQHTYGGKLCENVVQAVARDIQRGAMLRLERAGYPIVLHVYDEDVCEVAIGSGSIEQAEALMGAGEPWATYKGRPWPIKAAGGWRSRRYQKS